MIVSIMYCTCTSPQARDGCGAIVDEVLILASTLKRPISGRPRYGHVPLPGGLNLSYYDNKMAILQSQLLYYGTQPITLQRGIMEREEGEKEEEEEEEEEKEEGEERGRRGRRRKGRREGGGGEGERGGEREEGEKEEG